MLCIQIGTDDNPCRCKIVGPTVGFALGLLAALFCWPVGAILWLFHRDAGRHMMGKPMLVWSTVASAVPV